MTSWSSVGVTGAVSCGPWSRLESIWGACGGARRASGWHLEPLQGPLGALWAQFGVDLEQIGAQICVKSRAVTTKTDFCESAESFAPVDRNQGFQLPSSAENRDKSVFFFP